ncbi:MAG: hypothetical protein KGJ12_08325, partial [Gammaproteobacteria bacterium]|nr:hypothetical protein [Gammaproteobacteria bacterium]
YYFRHKEHKSMGAMFHRLRAWRHTLGRGLLVLVAAAFLYSPVQACLAAMSASAAHVQPAQTAMPECVHHAQSGPCAANAVTANDCHTLVCPTLEASSLKIGTGAIFSHVLFKVVPALPFWDKTPLHAAAEPYRAQRVQRLTPYPPHRFCVLLI